MENLTEIGAYSATVAEAKLKYDVFGRLVRTASPIPGALTVGGDPAIVTERYYCDGIRRIQDMEKSPQR